MDRALFEQDLIRDEQDRVLAYDDATGKTLVKGDILQGNLTIATGRNLSAKGLRDDERRLCRKNDMDEAEAELDRQASWWRELPEPAQRGLANLCFNMGWPRLAGFVHMNGALKDGNFELAAHELETSLYAGQVGDRARRIAQLFRGCA